MSAAAPEAAAAAAAAAAPPAAEPRLRVHNFSARLLESVVHFQLVEMTGSLFLWIGTSVPRVSHLAVSLQSRLDSLPSATTVLGGADGDDFGRRLAQRVTQRTGLLVVCSCNGAAEGPDAEFMVQRRVFDELRTLGLLQPVPSST